MKNLENSHFLLDFLFLEHNGKAEDTVADTCYFTQIISYENFWTPLNVKKSTKANHPYTTLHGRVNRERRMRRKQTDMCHSHYSMSWWWSSEVHYYSWKKSVLRIQCLLSPRFSIFQRAHGFKFTYVNAYFQLIVQKKYITCYHCVYMCTEWLYKTCWIFFELGEILTYCCHLPRSLGLENFPLKVSCTHNSHYIQYIVYIVTVYACRCWHYFHIAIIKMSNFMSFLRTEVEENIML